MRYLNAADRTDRFFLPCVTLIGLGCARDHKAIAHDAQQHAYMLMPPRKPTLAHRIARVKAAM